MKKLITICAAALATAALAADTDVGAIVTDKNVEDVAKVENLTGANAGKATVTIKDNNGTANAVTVYNAATIDTALAGKASTGDLAEAEENAQAAANAAYANATNNAAQTYVKKSGDTMSNSLSLMGSDVGVNVMLSPNNKTLYKNGKIVYTPSLGNTYTLTLPAGSGTFSLRSDITNDIPAWARAAYKPSYNFSEIESTPTTLSGYGITDAVPASRKIAGKALTGDVTLASLSIVGETTATYNGSAAASVNQTTLAETAKTAGGTTGKTLTLAVASTSRNLGEYYISIGTDGKPHLMLRQ